MPLSVLIATVDTVIENPSQYLNESLALMVEVIGVDATLSLVNEYGGIAVHIPNKAKPSHVMVELIGDDNFKELCKYFGGAQFSFPRCVHLLRAVRDEKILAERKAGKTNFKIARDNALTERQVRRILKKQQSTDNDCQKNLF